MQAPLIMKRLEQTLGRSYVRIGASASLIVFILHMFACIFHYVAIVSTMGRTWIQASGIVDSESIWDRCDRCRTFNGFNTITFLSTVCTAISVDSVAKSSQLTQSRTRVCALVLLCNREHAAK